MMHDAYFSLKSALEISMAFSFPCILQVFFKSGDGYRDVFGVAWPLRSDLPKVQTTMLKGAAFQAHQLFPSHNPLCQAKQLMYKAHR